MMNLMMILASLMIMLIMILAHEEEEAAAGVPVFTFGDSLSDVGNNNYIPFSVLKSNFVPYGVDYPMKTPTGRFSNGLLVLDIVGQRLGFPAADPYLSPRGRDVSRAMKQGVNYASAGCGILDGTSMNSSGCIPMSEQLRNHGKVVASLVMAMGLDAAQRLLGSALYFVAIGSNDFIGNYAKQGSPDAKAYTPAQFVALLANSLTAQIMKLYGQGARKLVVIGLGPLGCIPSQRAAARRNGACNADLNRIVVAFNAAVKEAVVDQMGSDRGLVPGMKITYANPYPVIEEFLANPSRYGFTDTSAACCGGGPTNSPCLPLFPYCPRRDAFMFWDIWHPSQAVNSRLVDALLAPNATTSARLVTPYSIRELFSA